ncbi:class I SAM-dependent methyltransferase [Rhodococcus sp. NPDC059968]|uniref:class I SAM-dependent methyltransferase n=1 Tax=Rhodococcus sp. NPDC059968 TaxID=3347017 RepID=UPI0036714AF5
MDIECQIGANRANWDERVDGHLIAYDVDGFVDTPTRLTSIVRADLDAMTPHLPDRTPAGLTLVHLQCHIGLDTLSWARLGANVTGVDFSPKSIEAATDIARRAKLCARFVESDVDHAAEHLGEQFDVVYTGIGALPWLPDLARWAQVIAALLRPGGLFYIRDSHPTLNALDYDRPDGELVLRQPYFAAGASLRYDDGTTYADPNMVLTNATTYEWPHSLSEIIGSLLKAGADRGGVSPTDGPAHLQLRHRRQTREPRAA